MNHGFVDGKILYTDSIHLKANANKKKFVKEYVYELDESVNNNRRLHSKKLLKKEYYPELSKIKISTTNPESGYMVRDDKPNGFFYLGHRTVDSKYNIITDVYVTPCNVNYVEPYIARLDDRLTGLILMSNMLGLMLDTIQI